MEWIAGLKGRVVGLDTAPLIYFIEENLTYLEVVRPFFEAVDHGDFQVVTSASRCWRCWSNPSEPERQKSLSNTERS